MKNITLSVDETTYRIARVRAAMAGTSVSAMVREYLESLEDPVGNAALHARNNQVLDDAVTAYAAHSSTLQSEDDMNRNELDNRDELRERNNQMREELLADISARGGGLDMSENLSRDDLYDRYDRDALR